MSAVKQPERKQLHQEDEKTRDDSEREVCDAMREARSLRLTPMLNPIHSTKQLKSRYRRALFLQLQLDGKSSSTIAYRLESDDKGIVGLDGSLDRIVRLSEANRLQQSLSNFMH